jgi:transcriptional regulator with XRE-family HTH domain
MNELGQRIRIIRQARQMTQDELGRAIGKTAAAIAAHESGRTVIKRQRLQELATALRVHRHDILSSDWRKLCERDGVSLEPAR